MDSKLIQEVRIEQQMNKLLKQIDYQLNILLNVAIEIRLCAGNAFIT